jgi:uncharacterized protein
MVARATTRWFPLRPRVPPEQAPRPRFDPSAFSPALATQLLVLQPTPFCNIGCDYCYLPHRDSKARMSLVTVRHAAQRLRDDGLCGPALTVVWHAGEPLTVPPIFYEQAFSAIEEIVGPGTAICHSIQTNATLIDDAWCAFFKRPGVRVGVSVDGPADLHDRHRRTRGGKGTHEMVLRGMRLLRAHGIRFHAIAVVTDATLRSADAFIDFFLEQQVEEVGCNFDEAEGVHRTSSFAGNEELHAAFLERLLERSMASGGRLRVRELANAFRLVAQGQPTYHWDRRTLPVNAQTMPFALITVGWNGDFCTFSPELLGQRSAQFGDFVLGNVARDGYLDSARTERFERMWGAIVRGTDACRGSCAHFNYCGGGAPANKLYENGDLASVETLYCRTMLKRPFDAVLRRLEQAPQ